jgi:Heterokaryon incompatibility protein (HET)
MPYSIPNEYAQRTFPPSLRANDCHSSHELRIGTAAEWLRKCDAEHGTHCQPKIWASGTDQGPWRLINVKEGKVVEDPKNARYAALSYCWGSRKLCLLRKETIADLNQPGAIQRPAPTLIKHAARFTKEQLDIPYLWVDSVCILQDDAVEKRSQIESMHNIYANVYVTLIAASAQDAQYPLSWRPSRSRTCCAWLPERVSPATRHTELLESSRWSTRGWTLQELLFSRRAIFFHEDVMTWQCHCTVWHSCSTPAELAGPCTVRFSTHANGLQVSSWANFEEYSRIVEGYSERRLTHEEDIWSAFAGIIGALSTVFPVGFIFGLPIMFLDVAILWHSRDNLLHRRKGAFPSWSWMGWKGQLSFDRWRLALEYLHDYNADRCVTSSVAEWKIKREGNSSWESLKVSRARYQHLRMMKEEDARQALQHEPSLSGWTVAAHGEKLLFSHSSDNFTRFRYPIPLRDPHAPVRPPRFLPCFMVETRRAFFRGYTTNSGEL